MEPTITTEVVREFHWVWGYCRGLVPIVAISIAFTATLEIVFRFILLARRKKRIEKMLDKKYEELTQNQEKVFWEYLRKKINGL